MHNGKEAGERLHACVCDHVPLYTNFRFRFAKCVHAGRCHTTSLVVRTPLLRALRPYIIIEASGPWSTQHGQSMPGLPLPARCVVPRFAVAAAVKLNIGRAAVLLPSMTAGG